MLGCHDFCGYYEWTFHYLRERFGEAALEKYWAEAIAADSQQHYLAAAQGRGLRGLNNSWLKTGDDEKCDWTVTLDENNNLLRLDMRECPSKGFLLQNDLNADEDYCNHCMGWIHPALVQVGAEVTAHEHNHCGQCWWEIRMRAAAQPLVAVAADIRHDPRWGCGYLDRYTHHERLPFEGQADFCEFLVHCFRDVDSIAVRGSLPGGDEEELQTHANTALIMTGQCYANAKMTIDAPRAVLLDAATDILPSVSRRFRESSAPPLLMHAYLPQQSRVNFVGYYLPRPAPILPLLIRSGLYTHEAGRSVPSPEALGILLAAALGKKATLVAAHPTADDRSILRAARQHLGDKLTLPSSVREMISDKS